MGGTDIDSIMIASNVNRSGQKDNFLNQPSKAIAKSLSNIFWSSGRIVRLLFVPMSFDRSIINGSSLPILLCMMNPTET